MTKFDTTTLYPHEWLLKNLFIIITCIFGISVVVSFINTMPSLIKNGEVNHAVIVALATAFLLWLTFEMLLYAQSYARLYGDEDDET